MVIYIIMYDIIIYIFIYFYYPHITYENYNYFLKRNLPQQQ